MAVFRRRAAAQTSPSNGLPRDIVEMMERAGRFEFDTEASGESGAEIWAQTQAPLLPLVHADVAAFVSAVRDAVLPAGGWAVYGATHTIWNVASDHARTGEAYLQLLDATVAFLRSSRVPPQRVTGYEWNHWLASGGTSETWLP